MCLMKMNLTDHSFICSLQSWKVLDVAVAMTYALISSYGKSGRSISAACAILRGFHHVYPLTVQERKHLRLLVACRLATSATFGNYTYNTTGSMIDIFSGNVDQYVVSDQAASTGLKVVSYVDNNIIQSGPYQITLDAGETGIFTDLTIQQMINDYFNNMYKNVH